MNFDLSESATEEGQHDAQEATPLDMAANPPLDPIVPSLPTAPATRPQPSPSGWRPARVIKTYYDVSSASITHWSGDRRALDLVELRPYDNANSQAWDGRQYIHNALPDDFSCDQEKYHAAVNDVVWVYRNDQQSYYRTEVRPFIGRVSAVYTEHVTVRWQALSGNPAAAPATISPVSGTFTGSDYRPPRPGATVTGTSIDFQYVRPFDRYDSVPHGLSASDTVMVYQRGRYLFCTGNGRSPFMATLGTAVAVGDRFKYPWAQAYKATAGYGGWASQASVTGIPTGLSSSDFTPEKYAWNLAEERQTVVAAPQANGTVVQLLRVPWKAGTASPTLWEPWFDTGQQGAMPIGSIIDIAGFYNSASATYEPVAVPDGWQQCNGDEITDVRSPYVGYCTPDLRGLFRLGANGTDSEEAEFGAPFHIGGNRRLRINDHAATDFTHNHGASLTVGYVDAGTGAATGFVTDVAIGDNSAINDIVHTGLSHSPGSGTDAADGPGYTDWYTMNPHMVLVPIIRIW